MRFRPLHLPLPKHSKQGTSAAMVDYPALQKSLKNLELQNANRKNLYCCICWVANIPYPAMGHLCRGNCKRKTGQPCQTCRTSGGARLVQLDERGKPVKPPGPHAHATPHEKGAAVDIYFGGHSYRRTAGNIGEYFGKDTNTATVYRWIRDLSKKADEALRPMKVVTGRVWVADEVVVRVGGKNYWLFNVMDSQTRFLTGGISIANPNHAGGGDGVGVGAATVKQSAGCGQDGWAGVIPGCDAAGLSNPPGATRRH